MLANARRDALAMASHAMGDDPWSVGYRAFAFGRHRLERAAASGEYPWLEVLDDSAHFVFVIGDDGNGVPVRFYRGSAEELTERTLKRQEMGVQQLSLALGETAAEGLAFWLAIETDGTGRVERVVFLALRGDDKIECFWPVPLEMPAEAAAAGLRLRLLADDGYGGSAKAAGKPAPTRPPVLPRRRAVQAMPQPQSSLL